MGQTHEGPSLPGLSGSGRRVLPVCGDSRGSMGGPPGLGSRRLEQPSSGPSARLEHSPESPQEDPVVNNQRFLILPDIPIPLLHPRFWP